MSFPKCETAIFSVIGAKGPEIGDSGIGTAVAIHANLLMTYYHVIEDADRVDLIQGRPLDLLMSGKAAMLSVPGWPKR